MSLNTCPLISVQIFRSPDYYSRDIGSMSRILQELNLPTLQQRRKVARLTFLYKISQGLVPGIPCENYLIPQKVKRIIKAKKFKDCVANNFVQRHQNLNKNSYELIEAKSDLYKKIILSQNDCQVEPA